MVLIGPTNLKVVAKKNLNIVGGGSLLKRLEGALLNCLFYEKNKGLIFLGINPF